ncbi:DUF1707 SHOCT-like domain-containing protein [Nonomuraea gerenzanensis]|uniref:DUF1707 domain-containing protein n=1 Tax=Nonomuraea gerenzanensis TaxID=93944 RepID=A0A1M4BLD6_9ACTN|nr:DUF1707 domain-containing protein [Nonomuraea gerenzanensis]UBU19181.1 DUF1707 domain-containing protein [Nonomuraea gerenzanensis]SAP16372.1 protein of unknown function DUF1707 [Nonomuraea gerenzanensis]
MTSDDDDFEFAFPRSWARRARAHHSWAHQAWIHQLWAHSPGAGRAWAGRGVRVGDAERDAVAAALREHYAQGRLSGQDLDERLAAVLTARYADDLYRVTADLPGSGAPGGGVPGFAAGGRKRRHDRLAPWLILAIVVAALLGGRNHYPGPLLVLLLVAAGVAVVAVAVFLLRRRA